jgi:hypothetical protein
MSLFRNENPNLGPQTSVQELSGYGAGNPVANNYKPTTRHIVNVNLAPAGAVGQWVFQAPWACTVVGARMNFTVQSAGAANLSIEKITGDTIAPAAANGTTIVLLTSAVVSMQGTANTRQNLTLSTAAGSPLNLNAGDQIALFSSASAASFVGLVQIELAQVG